MSSSPRCLPRSTPDPCESTVEVGCAGRGDAVDLAAFPDGVYRLDITQDDLRSFGVTNPDDIKINYGTITWTLEDGQAEVTQVSPDENWSGTATYTVDGDNISFELAEDWAPDLAADHDDVEDRRRGPDLRCPRRLHPAIVAWYESHPWTKVG